VGDVDVVKAVGGDVVREAPEQYRERFDGDDGSQRSDFAGGKKGEEAAVGTDVNEDVSFGEESGGFADALQIVVVSALGDQLFGAVIGEVATHAYAVDDDIGDGVAACEIMAGFAFPRAPDDVVAEKEEDDPMVGPAVARG
jgi:class 3 adenylate cyclase